MQRVLLTWAFGSLSWLYAAALPGQVVLNELLAQNGLSGVDEEGDNEDWCELLNRGAAEVRLAGFALTDDPLLPMKWVFPDVGIPPGGYLRVWLSGKDRFIPPPEVIIGGAGAFAFEPSIIAVEEDWRYLAAVTGQAGPPAGWKDRVFDDSGWPLGPSGFGYGDDDDFTELAPGTSGVFIRKRFTIEDPAKLKSLVLQVDFDDGFVAYLNGTRVAAENFGAGDPTFASVATGSRERGNPLRYDLLRFRSSLVAGENVLAMAGLNVIATSTDLSLIPELGTIPLVIHSNFKLDNDGEHLALHDPAGQLADEVTFPDQNEDHSYGRSPDGSSPWLYLLTPTPEAANQTLSSATPFSSKVAFDPPAGKYRTPFQVQVLVEPADLVQVRYTLDGSTPTPASLLYQGPLAVNVNTVFRAAGFIGAERSTRVISQSYFIGGTLTLPIISLSMEPADYLKVHNDAGASGRSSERASYMEIFTEDGVQAIGTGMGLRLHGGAGRSGDINTKKAYKCYFRRVYGDARLLYPLIPDTSVADFDKLVLRSGFNDAFRTNGGAAYIRDQLIRDLHEDMGALVSHGSWYNLYINMRFRGVYNVVERMDEEFLQSYTGTAAWDVIKTGNDVLSGENTEWERMHNYMVASDLSQPAAYAQASRLIDIPNFTSYMILNTWSQNHDWPHNNWYAARQQGPDGRWIFLSWDAEFGIGLIPGGYTSDSVAFTIGRSGYIRDAFASLLNNPEYRAYYAEEVDRHLFYALRPTNSSPHIDRLRAIINPDMPEEAALTGNNHAQWLNNINTCRTFVQNRGTPYRNFLLGSTTHEFPAPPRVFASNQARVVNVGGVIVRLRGVRFAADTDFTFNGVPAVATRLIPSSVEAIADVTLPLDLAVSGFPVIAVRDPRTNESSEARNLLEVASPVPEVRTINPAEGEAVGAERVSITGDHFVEGARVLFGGNPSPSVTRINATTLEVVTPPGQGEAEVLVVNQVQDQDLPALSSLRYTYLTGDPIFHRGDVNSDGRLDVADPVRLLFVLYVTGGALACRDAADFDDSGTLDVADAVSSLGFLFLGDEPPPAPHPACGPDTGEDQLVCNAGSHCR